MEKQKTEKFAPKRKCIVCGLKTTKDNFIKIVKNKSNEISVDTKNILAGRGAYICNNQSCIELLIKKNGLNRGFRTKVPPEVQKKIFEELK